MKVQGKYGGGYGSKATFYQTLTGIEAGTQGVFATCDRGKEARCVGELYSLFDKALEEAAAKGGDGEEGEEGEEEEEVDIETMMARELEGIRSTGKRAKGEGKKAGGEKKKVFASVRLDAQCVVFFRTNSPISPSTFVHAICEDALETRTVQSRVTHRLTPIERTGKATLEGLEEVAAHVLKPYFHSGQTGVKFAIRPSIRNHDVLKRDQIIQTIARCVGPSHKVDLKNYDVMILVEIYKNMCGMSVVTDWEKLKRFNLAQIQETVLGDHSKKPKPSGPGSAANTTAITPRVEPKGKPSVEPSAGTVPEVTQPAPPVDAAISTEPALTDDTAAAPVVNSVESAEDGLNAE
ncbi:hypothetical protein DFH27DRAFT_486193 [Peziza echinospora]|nr:hypothetical protein DFH27DRAFT_486193 [Peziza echinospora]